MEWSNYIRFAAALVFVLGLIGLTGWVLRRFSDRGLGVGPRSRRLRMVEMLPLDARTRLVLVERDGVGHLLLLGTTNSVVVESGIADTVLAGPGADLPGRPDAEAERQPMVSDAKTSSPPAMAQSLSDVLKTRLSARGSAA